MLTINQLIAKTNADPRRGVGHEKVLTRIKIDKTAIDLVATQGFGMDDVLPEGKMIKLTLTGNMSTGGISIDRTFEAHPENIEIAEEAARVVGLGHCRSRLHCARYHPARTRDRWRDLRSECRTRLPDAHPSDDR